MNDIKLAVLGSEGAGKSALTVRFLTRRFIGEYASNSECVYTKRLSLDGRQMNIEIYDPCSQPSKGKLSFIDELLWPDGVVVVYDISDRSSFVYAKALIYRMRETNLRACKRMDPLHPQRGIRKACLLFHHCQELELTSSTHPDCYFSSQFQQETEDLNVQLGATSDLPGYPQETASVWCF
ncbi:ras-related and estrogen-regulated growth inhibitor-like protein isoform X2 [Lissotriton helveticus]